MSSMLKKTGGLSFKPKAGRRPGAGAGSKPPASTTPSAPTTRAPTTEPPSQASTPAASTPSTSAVVDSIETAIHPANEVPIPAEPLPTPATLQTPSTSEPHAEIPAVQITPSSEPAASSPPPPVSLPVVQIPTPQPSNEVVRDSAPRPEPHRPATDLPSHDAQPTPSSETENSPPSTTNTSSQPLTATPAAALEPSAPEKEVTLEPSTAPSSPPPLSTATAASLRSGTTAPQPPTPKKQAPRRRKSTATDGGASPEGAAPKKKRQRTKSSTRATAEASEGASTEASKPTRRRKREPTPENAEELTVDHSTMTVGELTKDLGIGKRFRHAEEIEQRARDARAKYRLKKLEREKRRLGLLPPEDDLASQPDTPNENGESRGAAMAQLGASMEAGAGQGVGYDVVDGQIVVHAASLIVNRHNQDMSNLEEVEENDFTNLVNSASFAKRVQAPGNWTDEETEKFYRLLGMFGTDFETISRLFPGKNRRAIKLKFNKEVSRIPPAVTPPFNCFSSSLIPVFFWSIQERLRPNRVNAAMMVRGQKKVNIDIEEYKATQRQWQAKDKILAEHARLAQEHEREVARLREERRAAGLIDDDDQGAKTTTDANAGANGQFEVIEEDADALGQQGAQNAEIDMDTQPEGIRT
ncbi:hypothetical protein F5B21DRAFT_503333 [Xylaria acuta]|nr:hypothetical protein F5B21DRAFT_503333 [Xylaria acuta]